MTNAIYLQMEIGVQIAVNCKFNLCLKETVHKNFLEKATITV